jgi:hypothetical protein
MVVFFSHNDEVSVANAGGFKEQLHEVDDNCDNNGGANIKWTVERTNVIMQLVQNEARPMVIFLK